MTQGETYSYLEWWQCRPDIEVPLPGPGGPGNGGRMAGRLIVAADDSTSGTEDQAATFDRYQALLDRASAIYKENIGVAIDSEQLKDALDQAQSELREEALESRLQNLVDDGKMTQEEADSYLEWWQSRPDIEVPLPGLGGRNPRGGLMWDGGFGARGGLGPSPDVYD